MKDIYVLLTCTGTIFSRAIKLVTGSDYTHSSIGLDSDCCSLYSFARRGERLPLPAGFIQENIFKGLLAKNSHARCALYRIPVDEITYQNIKNQLELMTEVKHDYTYNLIGPFTCFFNIPYHSGQKYFCSEFVADILKTHGAITLDRPASLVRPNDFTTHNDLRPVFIGTLRELQHLIKSGHFDVNACGDAVNILQLPPKTAAF